MSEDGFASLRFEYLSLAYVNLLALVAPACFLPKFFPFLNTAVRCPAAACTNGISHPCRVWLGPVVSCATSFVTVGRGEALIKGV